MGIGFWQPLLSGWEWFPENKGLVSGFIFAGFGFGPVLFYPISSHLVNPGNLKTRVIDDGTGDTDKLFPRNVAMNCPYMLKFCLVLWSIFALIGVLGVKRNPSFVEKQKRIDESQENINKSDVPPGDDGQLSLSEALKTRRFFHIGLILFNGMFFGSYLVSTYKPVALNADVITDDQITIIGSLSMISNGAARIVWSSMQDKYGFKKVYFVLLCL